MEQEITYPYPIPEFIDHLNQLQEQDKDDEQSYSNLANMLKACHAALEYANAIWQEGQFADEHQEMPTYDALSYAMTHLVPVILKCAVGGWRELMLTIDNHHEYPWYDPNEDYPLLPPRLGTPEREAWERTVQEALEQEARMV